MDKSWMDAPRHTEEYLEWLARFLGYAFSKSSVENKILCPCKTCVNSYWKEESLVREHLVCEGFLEGYKQWMFHGECGSSSAIPPNIDEGDDRDEGDDISDLLRDLAAGLDLEDDLKWYLFIPVFCGSMIIMYLLSVFLVVSQCYCQTESCQCSASYIRQQRLSNLVMSPEEIKFIWKHIHARKGIILLDEALQARGIFLVPQLRKDIQEDQEGAMKLEV